MAALAPAPLSPTPKTYLTHTPSTATNTKQRNTVHWDKRDLEPSCIKENAAPKLHQPAPISSSAALEFGDWKFRGQHRRKPLAAETFIAPELLNRAVNHSTGNSCADIDQGNFFLKKKNLGSRHFFFYSHKLANPNVETNHRIYA